ncbi:ADP,ATP carrier protein 2, chloroplastic-like protein [Drosera capensis]
MRWQYERHETQKGLCVAVVIHKFLVVALRKGPMPWSCLNYELEHRAVLITFSLNGRVSISLTDLGEFAHGCWVQLLLTSKLADVLSTKALLYTVIVPFIAFFGAFGFVLYPLSNYFHPTALADKLLAVLGPRFLGPLAIMRIWSFCLFYVMAELWCSVVISVLSWGFANQFVNFFNLSFYILNVLIINFYFVLFSTCRYHDEIQEEIGADPSQRDAGKRLIIDPLAEPDISPNGWLQERARL